MAVWEVIRIGARWRIGDMASVRIWKEKWLPPTSTHQVQSLVFVLKNALVPELLTKNKRAWNRSLVQEIFRENET